LQNDLAPINRMMSFQEADAEAFIESIRRGDYSK